MSFDQTRAQQAARRIATKWTIFPAILLALLLTATTGYSFAALYVFGDSLSDTGRNPAPAPSYFNGRYSNGALWVEYLSAQLGLPYNASNNFAVSGSTTSDLASQIAGLAPSTNLQSALFTVWSAGNDFLDNIDMGVNDAAWSNVVTAAVLNLTNTITTLFSFGAREVIVVNLPNVGQTPALSSAPAGYPSYVDSKVDLFNTLLASALTSVAQQNPGLRIYPLDVNSLLNTILSAPATFGFTVTTIGALEDPNLTDKSFTGPGAEYVFWDQIHPTTKVHALVAALAFQSVGVQLNIEPNGTGLNLMVLNLYPGLPYTIQSSTDLSAWSNYQTLTAAATNATVALTNGPGTSVYYRVQY
jgi:thermolabile hemolysin